MRNKIFIIILFLLLFSNLSSRAQSYSYAFLQLPVSSRVNALGGSNIAIRDGDNSLSMLNPALLNESTHMVASMSFAYYMNTSFFGSLAYSHDYKGHYLGASLHYLDYGKFEYADIYGNRTGQKFSCKDFVLSLSYAHNLGELFSIGASLKPLYSVYERYTSWAFGADFGVHFHTPDSAFQMGLAIRNFGVQLKSYYSEEGRQHRELLPFDIELGLAYRFKHAPIRLSFTAHDLQSWKINYNKRIDQSGEIVGMASTNTNNVKWYDNIFRHTIFAVEIIPKSEKFYIALSYNHQRRMELAVRNKRALSGFAIGAGVRIKQFRVGFGISQYQAGNYAYQVSLSSAIAEFLK